MYLSAERAYPTPLSNSTLLPLLLLSLARQRHTPDASTKIKKDYDYIIVGGGSAGSVVASRLSELPCVSVLLLEAGHEPPLLTEVPALNRYFRSTDIDWQYKTAPQKYTGRSLVNRRVLWPSGKVLGGSSILNGMAYVRGNRRNYDDWADQGAKGWSFKDVYPYFLKMENNKDRDFLANGYHTTGGPVTVHKPRYEPELKRAVYRAATGLGYKIVDSNAARQTGFYDHQATLRESQRCSTAKAYLVPAENRTNLDILPNAMVKKIIIRNGQARGVQFDFRGYAYEVSAKKEVIVSAGTVNTAQLLMLSGVGPKRELQRLNIPVVADLPVGQNLHDHGSTHVPFVLNPRIPDFEEKVSDPENIRQYIRNRTGPLASTEGTNYIAFLKGQAIHTPVDFPNYELYFTEMSSGIPREQFGLRPEVYRKLYGPYENKPLFMCTVSQLQPRSRGTVTLQSKNPYDSPIIDPNYLKDTRDIEDLVQGMKTCQRIGTSRAMRKLGARPFKTLIPGCEKYADDEDSYFTCQARSILTTIHHPVGTAKMGNPRDQTTVVDPQLRVKNVKGLRVVDASVMPTITSGNTNIPTIMIAEKASDIIKSNVQCYKDDLEDWDEPEEDTDESDEDESDEEDWDKSKEEEYVDVSDHQWKAPEEESWLSKEKKTLNDYLKDAEEISWQEQENSDDGYLNFPKKSSWSESADDSDDYVSIPKKNSWSDESKYYLKDYIKDPKKISLIKNQNEPEEYSKGSLPISWYKKQTDLLLKEYNKPVQETWEDADVYSNSKWSQPERYKVGKSVDELVKLADMAPAKKTQKYRWNRSYTNSMMPWY